jgi:DNA polymerase-4
MPQSLPPNRHILHLALHEFYVAIERQQDQRLADRPLLITGLGARHVVLACSEEARRQGVRVGMPLRQAQLRCPWAATLRSDLTRYTEVSQQVATLIRAETPLSEAAAIDAFFVDLSGMDRFFGVNDVARTLGQRVRTATGLPLRLGLGPNKLLARIASGEARPGRLRIIDAEDVPEVLAGLSLRKLPGVGAAMAQQLQQLGLRRIGDLQRIPRLVLVQTFGTLGQQLYQHAQGQDEAPVQPDLAERCLRRETTFAPDTDDPALLQRRLTHQVEQLGFDLRQMGLLTACLTLRLRYSDGESLQRQARIPFCASDELLMEQARVLLRKLHHRRVRVRQLVLTANELIPGQPQLMLFQSQARQVELYQALDAIKARFGAQGVQRASGLS